MWCFCVKARALTDKFACVDDLLLAGRYDDLRKLADDGDATAAYELPKVLDEPALRARADAGDHHL